LSFRPPVIQTTVVPIICHSDYLSFRLLVIPTPEESIKGFPLHRSFTRALDDSEWRSGWQNPNIVIPSICHSDYLSFRLRRNLLKDSLYADPSLTLWMTISSALDDSLLFFVIPTTLSFSVSVIPTTCHSDSGGIY